jgi:hypothetical protein
MNLYRARLITLVFVLYLASCLLPAVQIGEFGSGEFHHRREGVPGWKALLLGWVPPTTWPWAANPLLLAGLFCYAVRRYAVAFGIGVATSLAGLTTYFFLRGTGDFEGLLVGYYVWEASFVAFTLAAYSATRAAIRPPTSLEEIAFMP